MAGLLVAAPPAEPRDGLGGNGDRGPGGGSVSAVSVKATNQSDHPVRVTGIGIDLQDGSCNSMHLATPNVGSSIPGVVQPHDSGDTWIAQAEVEKGGLNVYEPVRAWVRLATGEVVHSTHGPLMRRG